MTDRTNSASPKIRLRGVRKRFGANIVLGGIDLDIAAGESVVVIGGSGSGKSVLLKCILGLLRPDEGSIQIDGQEIVGLSGRARDRVNDHIGMLFQGAALFDSLPVWQNVAFGLIQGRRASRTEARDRAMICLDQVGLKPHVADLFPAELSGGMQKRVGLARAIASQPDIVFFDEPTTGLDPIMSDVINDLIVATTRDLGATALSITHDMASATKIGDRIAMLYEGRLIWVGEARAVFDSGNTYVDQFVHGRAEGPITDEADAAAEAESAAVLG